MNNEGGLVPTNLSEIIEKFNSSIRKFALKETEWMMQKGNLESKLAELEGQVKAHENINIDLLKRIKMLEYALNQERIKNSKLIVGSNESEKEELKFNNNLILNDIEDKRQLLKEEDIKILREKTIKPSLLAMLNDIGINENLANNLYTDLELNKTELERLIKSNMNDKLNNLISNIEPELSGQRNNLPHKSSSGFINTGNNQIQENYNSQNSEQLDNYQKNITNTTNSNSNQSLSLSRFVELKSHFDVVRKLGYLPNLNSLISISEDCLIKVWSLNNINFSTPNNEIEPYLVLRGHTGPLFSLAIAPDNSNLIYTAGNEGIIKIWKILRQDEVSQYGDTEAIFNCNVGFFQKPTEVVWDIKHHPRQKLLVSLNADSNIYLWETSGADEYIQSINDQKYDKWFKCSKSRPPSEGNYESPIPTNCCFNSTSDNQLICGFNDSTISIYDINKNMFQSVIKTYKSERPDNTVNYCDYQSNCLISSSTVPIIYGGFEDSTIKTIDLRTESVTNSFTAHSDAVTSLNLINDIYLLSTSHDTKIKMWDIRYMNSPIQEAIGSQKKWDEAIWHSVLVPNQLLYATGKCLFIFSWS